MRKSQTSVAKYFPIGTDDRAGGTEAVEMFGNRFRFVICSFGIIVWLVIVFSGNLYLFLHFTGGTYNFELLGCSRVIYLDLGICAIEKRVTEIGDTCGHMYFSDIATVSEAITCNGSCSFGNM